MNSIICNDVTVSGVLFALDPIQNPRAYVRATFRHPDKVRIVNVSGRNLSFTYTESFTNNSLDFTDIISSLTYGDGVDSNITYELCFSPKNDNSRLDYLPNLSQVS